MFRPRLIPVLLLRKNALVKSTRFTDHRYIGDPINAVRIFNHFKCDELIFLDIDAARNRRTISPHFIKQVGEEADMPFAVGGGIHDLDAIRTALAAGAEKVIIGTAAVDTEFIKAASDMFGASSITVCMDVKKNWLGKEQVWIKNGKQASSFIPEDFARLMEESGAGEIIVQSILKDGMMEGYDIQLLRKISQCTTIPVVALGGAGSISHLQQAYTEGMVNGLAAGSFFIYRSAKKGVLLHYPERKDIFSRPPT
jgi:cyclase